jgi:hypothetical protein
VAPKLLEQGPIDLAQYCKNMQLVFASGRGGGKSSPLYILGLRSGNMPIIALSSDDGSFSGW